MRWPVERLTQALGYSFRDPALLELALTHRSAGGEHNERLEYLGDAALGFLIAEALYQHFPQADEGQLSRFRASLVRRETLAEIGRQLNLSHHLLMGSGELRTGGPNRSSTLADAFEAVLGAIYLDGGVSPLRQLLETLYAKRIQQLDPQQVGKDPKTRLQERMQSSRRPLPLYEVTGVEGEQHEQLFQVLCTLQDTGQNSQGSGSSRRRAEQDAASHMLERIGE